MCHIGNSGWQFGLSIIQGLFRDGYGSVPLAGLMNSTYELAQDNPMTTTPELTETLHATYQQLVGRPVELDYLKRQMWSVWKNYCKHDPFTEQDLRLVIKYLKFKINKGDCKPSRLLFRNMIESPDYFQENRTDARGWSRAPRGHTDKASVLKSSGRPSNVKSGDTERIGSVLNNLKCIEAGEAAFRAFKEAAKRL